MKPIDTLIQLQAIKEQIEDLMDQARKPAAKKPAKAPAKKKSPKRTRGVRAPGANNKLAIVVGHTAAASGADGIAPINTSEYPWNTDLAKRIGIYGASQGVEVQAFFRDSGGVPAAYAAVKAWGARAAIELHFNAADGIAKGTETLHGTAATSKSWATRVQNFLVALYGRTGTQNRGLRECPPHPRGGASVNALPDIPTCLIEPFFGDNTTDAALGQSKQQQLAETLVDAFKTQFGV